MEDIIRKNVKPVNENDRMELIIYYRNIKIKDLIMKNNIASNNNDHLSKSWSLYKFTCPHEDCELLTSSYIGMTIKDANGIFPAGLFLVGLFPAGIFLFPARTFPRRTFPRRNFPRRNYPPPRNFPRRTFPRQYLTSSSILTMALVFCNTTQVKMMKTGFSCLLQTKV